MEAAGPELPGERVPAGGAPEVPTTRSGSAGGPRGRGASCFLWPLPMGHMALSVPPGPLCPGAGGPQGRGRGCWQEGWSFQVVVGRGGLSDTLT